MEHEKCTKTIVITPTLHRFLRRLAENDETMNGIIRKVTVHYCKMTHRNYDELKYDSQENKE